MRVMRRSRRTETVFALAAAAVGVALHFAHPLAGAGSPRFRDVAGASSFHYTTRNDYRGVKYFIQPICGGVVIFDYDGDRTPWAPEGAGVRTLPPAWRGRRPLRRSDRRRRTPRRRNGLQLWSRGRRL